MSIDCARCGFKNPCGCSPSIEELEYAGFEHWQIVDVKQLPPKHQWLAYEEFMSVMMSGGDTDSLEF